MNTKIREISIHKSAKDDLICGTACRNLLNHNRQPGAKTWSSVTKRALPDLTQVLKTTKFKTMIHVLYICDFSSIKKEFSILNTTMQKLDTHENTCFFSLCSWEIFLFQSLYSQWKYVQEVKTFLSYSIHKKEKKLSSYAKIKRKKIEEKL